jgi:hypothetical protein
LIENRGWTHEDALTFKAEVERLRELWNPGPEPTTSKALKNFANHLPEVYRNIERMNAERHAENERKRKEHLVRIELENRNLEWPRSPEYLINRLSCDYWKNGCIYCDHKYIPQTTHDYEVHIVTQHPGKPAYPGPADLRLYGLGFDSCKPKPWI